MRRAVLAVLLTVIAAMPATAYGLFGPEYCARTYSESRDARRGDGWKVLGIYFTDGRTIRQKMTAKSWTKCECPKDNLALCDCCEFDVGKVCAEVKRINTTTNNHLRLGPCEEGNP